MNSEPQEIAAEMVIPVRYQSGVLYNRDLAGRGVLTIRGGQFVFTGRQRGAFFSGAPAELILSSDQICNASRLGRQVRFTTPVGRSGQKQTPFRFFCADTATAVRVLAALPRAKDLAQIEAEGFASKLRALSAGESPFRSVTNLLIGANVVAFVIMGFLGAGWFETASMRPYILYVANNGAATTDGEWWRLLTAMFVHYGLLHLLVNMWALYQLGHLVERLLGRALFAMMYFASGITGSLATLVWHGDKVWSAGASGAVFGVCGALLGYLWREKHGMPRTVLQPLMKSTVTFAGYNLFFGAVYPHIDNVCHIGGLLGGIAFGWIAALPLDRDVRARATAGRLVTSAGVLVVVLMIGMALAPRYNDRIGDELRWEDAVTGPIKQEPALLRDLQNVLAAATNPAGEAAARAWIEQKAIPFYAKWRSDLTALTLTPGKVTAQRRDGLVRVLTMKLDSLHGLLEAKDWGDPKVAERYRRQQEAIAFEIEHSARE